MHRGLDGIQPLGNDPSHSNSEATITTTVHRQTPLSKTNTTHRLRNLAHCRALSRTARAQRMSQTYMQKDNSLNNTFHARFLQLSSRGFDDTNPQLRTAQHMHSCPLLNCSTHAQSSTAEHMCSCALLNTCTIAH